MTLHAEQRGSDSPYIEKVWRAQSDHAGSFTSLASIYWEMVVRRSGSKCTFIVRGPETKATPLDFPAGPEWFGITFKLGVFMPHLPPGSVLDLHDAVLPPATHERFWLHSSLWETPSYENAETFAERLARAGLLVRDPVIEAVLQGHPPALSPRMLQYRFVQATGLTHKSVKQIERARRALALLEQGTPILDTVFETGYFDQSHLTNSLRHFTGQTPASILRHHQP
jgi:hypothetical protein